MIASRAAVLALLFALASGTGAALEGPTLAQPGTTGVRLKLQQSLLAPPPERKPAAPISAESGGLAPGHVRVARESGLAADLLSIYREAQTADPVYAAARASYRAGQEKLPQGRAGLLPAITLSAQSQSNRRQLEFRDDTLAERAAFRSYNVNVTASQPLFRYQNWVTYTQAKHEVSQAEAIFLQAEQDLIGRVAQAYVDVLLAGENLALTGAQMAAFAEQSSQARSGFELGTATIMDMHDAKARHDIAVAQEIAAQNDLKIRNQALERIIARPPPQLAKLASPFVPLQPNPGDVDAWVDQAIRSSAQMRIAQEAVNIAEANVSRNRAGHLPTLDAVTGYVASGSGTRIEGGTGTDSSTRFIGLQLAIPFYLGGLTASRVREAIAVYDKAREDLENAKRTVVFNTRSAFFTVTNAVSQSRALEAALSSSQSSLDSTVFGLKLGVRTRLDVLNAQQLLVFARREQIQTIYGYIVNVLKLKGAAGSLTEDDLLYVNQWLQK